MSESEKIRVLLNLNEVDPNQLKGLLEAVGGFAVIQSLKIEMSADDVESVKYNPELVSWITDQTGNLMPVITRENLTEFAGNNHLADKPLCSRLFNSLVKDKGRHPNDQGEPFGYMIRDDSGVSMLRADALPELSQRLVDGSIFILGVSIKSKQLLVDLESSLIV